MNYWILTHEAALWWAGALAVLSFAGTLIIIPVLVVRMPVDYFVNKRRHPGFWAESHPVIRISALVLKNLLGLVLLVAGVFMLFLPGQGILTMLIGITLMNFPGKLALERSIVRQPAVAGAVNWLRAKARRQPLIIPLKVDRG